MLVYAPPMTPLLDVIHEDDCLLVFNKPSGLLSVPGRLDEHKDSLQLRAQAQYPDALTVHRLDMETSGIIVMAKGKEAHRNLSRQFQERATQKTYIARVDGQMAQDEGLIDLPLICDWPNRPRQMVDHDVGKPSQTKWQVLARGEDETRLKLTPITGRTHQLRVHCMALGNVILGDSLYATGEVIDRVNRLMLHAESLTITHPSSNDPITFHSPAPF